MVHQFIKMCELLRFLTLVVDSHIDQLVFTNDSFYTCTILFHVTEHAHNYCVLY